MDMLKEGVARAAERLVDWLQSPFFAVIVGVLALFLLIAQRLHIRELRRREERYLQAHDRKESVGGWYDPLFAEAPFAAALVARGGHIAWGNPRFWKLFGERCDSLSEIDQQCYTHLASYQHGKVQAYHTDVSLPAKKAEAQHLRRLYTVITWPVQQRNGGFTLFAFFEQTGVQRRRQHHAEFESQLVTYLSGLSAQLSDTTDNVLSTTEAKTEIDTMLALLEEHHTALRKPTPHKHVDLSGIWKEVFKPVAEVFRRRRIHVLVTLPHEHKIYAEEEDLVRTVRLLLEAVADLIHPDMTLRVQLTQHGRYSKLTFNIPELILPPRQLKLLFAFGVRVKRTDRFAALQLKLALAKQMVVKYNGHLEVSSAEELGTQVTATFANVS